MGIFNSLKADVDKNRQHTDFIEKLAQATHWNQGRPIFSFFSIGDGYNHRMSSFLTG